MQTKQLQQITLGSVIKYGARSGRAIEVNPWFVTFESVENPTNLSEGFSRDFSDLIFDGYKWTGPRPTNDIVKLAA